MDHMSRYSIIQSENPSHTVFKVMDRICFQTRILKRLPLQEFYRELYFLRTLQDYPVPRLVDAFTTEDRGILILQEEPGETLEDHIRQKGPLEEGEVLRIGIQLCELLYRLQKRKPMILHMDLKPANIQLRPDGSICLLDFGSALQYWPDGSTQEQRSGTKGYSVSHLDLQEQATDLYSLGKILFRMVHGYGRVRSPYRYSRTLRKLIRQLSRPIHRDPYGKLKEVTDALRSRQERMESEGQKDHAHTLQGMALAAWIILLVVLSIIYTTAPTIGRAMRVKRQEVLRKGILEAEEELLTRLQYVELFQAGNSLEISPERLQDILWQQELVLQQNADQNGVTRELLLQITEVCELYRIREPELGQYAYTRQWELCRTGLARSEQLAEDVQELQIYFLQNILRIRQEAPEIIEIDQDTIRLYEMRIKQLQEG